MSETAGVGMLVAVALLLVITGLPAWLVLLGVALLFAVGGMAAGVFTLPLLTAMPARLLGLLEQDILQALPLYVLMGALLNHLPLAEILFRTGNRALARTGAGPSLTGLGLGVLLAPMNGAVGASVAMLSRTVQPRLDACGLPPERSAALVCVASTMGIVIPPSLVLILLGDAMMPAHTEATNLTHESVRIINTQDVFVGALVRLGMGEAGSLLVVLAIVAACALVLDAFEMIFVVIPVAIPPLLALVHDATWVAVLTLLILQASFLTPPFGYALLMVRNSVRRGLSLSGLARALLPYLAVQLLVVTLVLAWPALVWQRNPTALRSGPADSPAGAISDDEARLMIEHQLLPLPVEESGKDRKE